MRNVSDKIYIENQNTYFLMFNNFFNRAVYVKMWINIVDLGRPQATIWSILIACWITTVIKTQSEDAILVSFQLEQWLHERTSMLWDTCSVRIVTSY
jgi:hypothetical protein